MIVITAGAGKAAPSAATPAPRTASAAPVQTAAVCQLCVQAGRPTATTAPATPQQQVNIHFSIILFTVQVWRHSCVKVGSNPFS